VEGHSPWWLIAKGVTDHIEVFTLDGGSSLPVFSDQDEPEMYLSGSRGHAKMAGGAQELLRGADIGALPGMSCRSVPGRSS